MATKRRTNEDPTTELATPAGPRSMEPNAPAVTGPGAVLALQRQAGNHAVAGALGSLLSTTNAMAVQRAAGDGPNSTLSSPRFAGDRMLQACYEDRARLTKGAAGDSVRKVQQALADLGYDLGKRGVDGSYGDATWKAVKKFKKDERLGWESIGDVGPGTMRRLDALFPDGDLKDAACGCDDASLHQDGEQAPARGTELAAVQRQPRAGGPSRRSRVPSECRHDARACFSVSQRTAWLLRAGHVIVSEVPALGGRPGHRTPIGRFRVNFKDANHVSSIYHAPMPFYVNFAPAVGFHQGSLVVLSHGCVHLATAAARQFFDYLQVGDKVDVVP